jgi:hypothetical protein
MNFWEGEGGVATSPSRFSLRPLLAIIYAHVVTLPVLADVSLLKWGTMAGTTGPVMFPSRPILPKTQKRMAT